MKFYLQENNMGKKRFIVLAGALLCFLSTGWLQAEEWDLKKCVEIGLKKNPAIKAATKGIEGAEARVKQSRSGYYPYLFAETDYTRYNSPASGSSLSSLNSSPSDLTSYYLGLSQNIYDFGRREYKVLASQEDLKAYQWTLRDVRLSVIDAVRQAYYGVLLAQRVVKLRQEDLEKTKEHYKQAQGFYQVGLKSKIDVTQAEVTVISSQKNLLQAENNVQSSRVVLATTMGLEQLQGITLRDDLDIDRVNWLLDDLTKEAMEKDPILNRLKVLIKYWEVQEQAAKREFWPTLTGTAKYGRNMGGNYDNDETWNLGLQLNIPIFSGFLKENRLAEIRAVLSQAKSNEQIQILQVLNNLQNLYLSLKLAEKQIDVAKESLRSARENLDLAEGRYKAGVGAMLDVTDARNSYLQAETDYNQALYAYTSSRYKLERAVGRE